MKTMYLAIYGVHFAVEKTEIVKENDKHVFYLNWAGRQCKLDKLTKDACFFDTEHGAWHWLYGKACLEYNIAQSNADLKLVITNNIAEILKKHL